MTDLAIIIVSWNVRDLLADCLRSVQADLRRSRQLSGQIWVVDNASSDDSLAMLRHEFPDVKLIASDKNLGFARGNNAALRALGFRERDYPLLNSKPTPSAAQELPAAVLLLNPDTLIHEGGLQTLIDFLKDTPDAGIVGPQLRYGDGSFQHAAFAFPGLWQLAIELLPLPGRLVETGLNGRYPRSLYAAGEPFPVDHPLGAAMCVRKEAIQQVGLLDEAYHMYVEEIDWSRRIVAAGWRGYCLPRALVTHLGGQSTGQIRASSFLNLWRSRYYFYRKYYSPFKLWLAGRIVQIGLRRRKRQDVAAATQGQLTELECSERLTAYKEVISIWQGSQL